MRPPKKVIYRAWCGQYWGRKNSLGWLMPPYLDSATPLSAEQRASLAGKAGYAKSDFYRVKVTLEPIRNKHGRFIVRRAP